jgi:hypothetical protein
MIRAAACRACPKTTLQENNPMATTKPPKKTAAQKQAEKLQGQLKMLKEKRKTLNEQITAKQTEFNKAKEALKAEKAKS